MQILNSIFVALLFCLQRYQEQEQVIQELKSELEQCQPQHGDIRAPVM